MFFVLLFSFCLLLLICLFFLQFNVYLIFVFWFFIFRSNLAPITEGSEQGNVEEPERGFADQRGCVMAVNAYDLVCANYLVVKRAQPHICQAHRVLLAPQPRRWRWAGTVPGATPAPGPRESARELRRRPQSTRGQQGQISERTRGLGAVRGAARG